MVPYLSRIEGPPPKRNVARSNRAGIAILPTRFDRFAPKSSCETGRIFLFQDTPERKKTANGGLTPLADF